MPESSIFTPRKKPGIECRRLKYQSKLSVEGGLLESQKKKIRKKEEEEDVVFLSSLEAQEEPDGKLELGSGGEPCREGLDQYMTVSG